MVGVAILCGLSLAGRSRAGSDRIDLHQRLAINHATVASWTLVPGVGPRTAEAIDERRRAGAFVQTASRPASSNEVERALKAVPGVGPQTLRRMRPFLDVHCGVDR